MTVRTLMMALLIAPLLGAGLSACSVSTLNAVLPHDQGAELAASGLSYGRDSRQKLDIYAPATGVPGKGTIVFVYGGSWSSGDRADYAFAAKAFASEGFHVALIDYRLVPQVRYPDFVADTAKAVAWTARNIASYGGDPRRLFVVGHSAGAYNALMVAVTPEFMAAEGLSTRAIRGVVGLSGPYDFLPLDVGATRAAFGVASDLEATQPVNRAARAGFVPPVLLVTGDADTTVYPRNTTALAAALRASGHSAKVVTYPDVGHAGTLVSIGRARRDSVPVLRDVTEFLTGL